MLFLKEEIRAKINEEKRKNILIERVESLEVQKLRAEFFN
jgi:hypothetical protein